MKIFLSKITYLEFTLKFMPFYENVVYEDTPRYVNELRIEKQQGYNQKQQQQRGS